MISAFRRQFGYYQVGQLTTVSKIEALEWNRRFGSPINYKFNDEEFDCWDWTIEPKQSLTELYQKRAQQIRDKYDYIVLFYSGGADSHNMLMSFVSQGLYIDEICSFGSVHGDGDIGSSFNREVFETARPIAQSIVANNAVYNTTRIRFLDLSDYIIRLLDTVNLEDFMYVANSTVSVNNVARQYIRTWHPEYQQLMENKQVCFVWGHDKPRTQHRDGKFGIHFLDINDNCVGPWAQSNLDWHDELFYSTPAMPEIAIKQAHSIMHWSRNHSTDHAFWTTKVTGLGHCIKHQGVDWQAWWITQDGLSSIIYPWFNPLQYYEPKPLNSIYSQRDRWYWKDAVISSKFNCAIDHMRKTWGNSWLKQDHALGTMNTVGFFSKFRYIEK